MAAFPAWFVDNAWIFGSIIVGIVTLQTLVALVASIRRGVYERERHQKELELLDQRVAFARTIRENKEHAALAWNGYRKFEVESKVDEGGDICSFYLAPHDGKSIAGFQPGQYLTFGLDLPDRDKPLIRCYSLSDAPSADRYRVSIKRMPPPRDKPDAPPGLSSNHFHDQIREGDILDVKAPAGHFFLDMTKEKPVVLIAGGVGITPVLSMLNAVIGAGSKRETWFFYGVRHAGEHIMREHLERIDLMHPNVHLHVCYSDVEPGGTGPSGVHLGKRVSVELFKELLPSNNYDFYMCGPPPMMQALTSDLAAWGVQKDFVHLEAFGPASVKKTKTPAETPDADVAKTLDVTFGKSGKTITWDPTCDSILEFAEAHGIAIESGCRAGNCGTCLTAIKSGDVEYSTDPGAEPEQGSCLTCVCIPKGPLVLDA